jgi:hypothetical protein
MTQAVIRASSQRMSDVKAIGRVPPLTMSSRHQNVRSSVANDTRSTGNCWRLGPYKRANIEPLGSMTADPCIPSSASKRHGIKARSLASSRAENAVYPPGCE